MDSLDVFRPETRAWFERNFEAPTPAQAQGWPAIAGGGHVLIQAPTGSGKTLAAFLSAIDRLTTEPGAGPPTPLRLAAQGAQLRRRAEPPRPARRPPLGAARRRPHRRHAAEGARGHAPRAAGHPDHDPGVAVPPAHLAGARAAAQRRHADPRRGSRRRGHQARRPPRALGRAARGAHGAAFAAHRPLGDAAPTRGDRQVRVGRPPDRARRRRRREGARPRGRRPGRGHARAGGDPARRAGRRARSGPPSTRRSSSSSKRTARRSSSSTTGDWPSGSRCGSTKPPKRR